jgi:Tol biopolymer transport system component
VTHFEVSFPPDVEPYPATNLPPALSPDGRIVATVGVKDGLRYLLFRRLDRPEATEVPEAGGANGAVFSPDGDEVAILGSSAQLSRLSLLDKQRKILATGVELTSSLTWGEAGIVFTRGGALWLVSPDGGEPRTLTALDAARHEVLHNSPVLLPGGRLLLFTSQAGESGTERIESVPIDGGARSVVIDRARSAVWSPTGHLLFVRDDALMAIAFDPVTGLPQGTAIPVMRVDALETLSSGQLAFALSPTGTLLFAPAGFTDTRLVSVARDGTALALDLPSGWYANPRISPDGSRLLVESGGSVIETLDLTRGTRARLTAAALGTLFSTWNADGKRVVFRRFNIPFWAAGDGTGVTGFVPGGTVGDFPASAGPDPDSFVGIRVTPETSSDIMLMSISGAFPPKTLIATPAYDGGGQLSPDGRWLLYQSDTSGRAEIYLRRYPELDRQWQVSDGGGIQAHWSRNMREIFYRSGRSMVAAAFTGSGAEPVFGKPTTLFTDDYDFGAGASIPNYDVTGDGRFIMIRRGPNGGRLRVVVNWTEELKRIIATGGVR